MSTPVCTIDDNGITVPTYDDILNYLTEAYQTIYGSDIYIESDSMDGQLLAIFALAISDANAMAAAVYNSFSPSTAQGTGLSSVVKINGIARNESSYSTVDLDIVGQVGTIITSGQAQDTNGYIWDLPATVTIPTAGTITVTATCETEGAISAAIGTVTTIYTPTRGWQTVTNASEASEGEAVETDAALRRRQTTSTALPSRTVLEGIVGAIAAIDGVTRYRAYENDTSTTDDNGIPSHSISLVIEGGDVATIAADIAAKKTPGAGTYGTTSDTVTDDYGIGHTISFFRPTSVPISVAVTLKALSGYTTTVEGAIQTAIANYINNIDIGDTVDWDECIAVAKGVTGYASFRISGLILSTASVSGSPDLSMAFNEASTCDTGDITFTVTT